MNDLSRNYCQMQTKEFHELDLAAPDRVSSAFRPCYGVWRTDPGHVMTGSHITAMLY